jgi:hypothetical protein
MTVTVDDHSVSLGRSIGDCVAGMPVTPLHGQAGEPKINPIEIIEKHHDKEKWNEAPIHTAHSLRFQLLLHAFLPSDFLQPRFSRRAALLVNV